MRLFQKNNLLQKHGGTKYSLPDPQCLVEKLIVNPFETISSCVFIFSTLRSPTKKVIIPGITDV